MKITTLILIAFVRISGFGQGGFTGVPISNNNPIIERTKLLVSIGTQIWMSKNLDVSTFRNGDTIPEAKTNEEWKAADDNKQAAWCYYDNKAANGTKYGKLYNWYAVNDERGLAPVGWHVPTDQEWTVLSTFLGGEDVAGEKIKMSPLYGPTKISYVDQGGYYEQNWVSCSNCEVASAKYKEICPSCKGMGGKSVQGKFIPKTKGKVETKGENSGWNGTNNSGFSGLPGGYRTSSGSFDFVGAYGDWWSASEVYGYSAWNRELSGSYSGIFRSNGDKYLGFSVRCVENVKNGPFGTGGTSGGTGTGNGALGGPGSGEGDGGTGTSTGTGDGKNRVRLNDVVIPLYKTDVEIDLHLKLIINEDGKVVSATNIASKTTTTDQRIIHAVISAVMKQVKYNERKNAGLEHVYLTYKIRAQ